MNEVQMLQERAKVWAELQDLRGKRVDGKFTDPVTQSAAAKASAEFERITGEIVNIQARDAANKEEARQAAAMEAQTRTTANTNTTQKANVTYDESFWRWAASQRGAEVAESERRMLETRGTSTQIGTTNSLGGFTIPQSFSNTMETMMKWYGGMLEAADIMQDDIGGVLHYPSLDDTATSGAIIAQGVATTVSDLTIGNIAFGEYTVDSKIIKIGEELLNDERVGLLQNVLGDILPQRLGRAMNTLLTTGTGTSQPYGLTTCVTSSALTTAGATAITKPELLRVRHSVDKAYSQGPKVGWMMHYSILGYLRGLDLGNNDTVQLFVPSLTAGEPDRLLGLPVFVNNDLEAANATTGLPVTAKKHIYFGDFSKYKIRRIGGISLGRNEQLYWAERAVGFMGWMRFDGKLVNTNAIKSLLQA
jgi:HK97 family phage major capsid protein